MKRSIRHGILSGLLMIPIVLLTMNLSCIGANENNRPGNDDIDTGTTDSDSDGDSDTDIGDGGPIVMDCSNCQGVGPSLEAMVCALDLCDPDVVIQNNVTSPMNLVYDCFLEETYEAVSHFGSLSNHLAPLLNGSYALLASGNAEETYHSDWCDDDAVIWTDPYAPLETSEGFDVVEWKLVITAPEQAKAFRFKYVFFSAEYDDFISSVFNDKFYAILEAGTTNGGSPTVINFTECRDQSNYYDFVCDNPEYGCELDQKYCYIAINSALSECCWYPKDSYNVMGSDLLPACPDGFWTTDISGTGYECAESNGMDDENFGSSTGWLQTSWPIQGGETFALTFHVHDTADGSLDSEVILDAFEFLTDQEQGTVVVQ